MKLGVIAAGEGSRLIEEGLRIPKPLINISGITLLERITIIAKKYKFDSINIIINKEFQSQIETSGILDSLKDIEFNCLYKSTPGSLYSLNELKTYLTGDFFFLMTIDSIFREKEFEAFFSSVSKEEADAVIAVTGYIDDEKPLWVKTDDNGFILEFSNEKKSCEFVTGGIYFFRSGIIELTGESLASGRIKLRQFLQYLIEKGKRLKAFTFSKIIDVDHNTDIKSAEEFLKNEQTKMI